MITYAFDVIPRA